MQGHGVSRRFDEGVSPDQRRDIVLLRLRALFSHGILFTPQLEERVGDLRALGEEKREELEHGEIDESAYAVWKTSS
ncbi:hypothetical protein HMPREF9238_00713 [Gleimia europaea ACS-120-V-Col10b]|uniref:Uncharacterized protein n=1 Tax=Gleimia europaea ACS-120-V-Col10b TaxID=883069 RepID=A0A9W5REH3_9ACTO|nr:hypothetical protein HMPREF9238_00713 [Gleimia europaea ACS-120-V-Col10b]